MLQVLQQTVIYDGINGPVEYMFEQEDNGVARSTGYYIRQWSFHFLIFGPNF